MERYRYVIRYRTPTYLPVYDVLVSSSLPVRTYYVLRYRSPWYLYRRVGWSQSCDCVQVCPQRTATTSSKRASIVVVGLGNPGVEYSNTRHNIGMMLVERLAIAFGFSPWERSRDSAQVSFGSVGDGHVILAKPSAFMNLSGKSVAKIAHSKSVSPSQILVCHDDLDLELGRMKLKFGGSAGGHRGVLSCEQSLRTKDFWRLRIGIGRPESRSDVADFVLEPIPSNE